MIFRSVYHYDHFEFLPLIVLFIQRNAILPFNSTINIVLEVVTFLFIQLLKSILFLYYFSSSCKLSM